MTIYEPQDRAAVLPALLALWEASVRATHSFLSEGEIARIRAYVPAALTGVAQLAVAESAAGEALGFLGAAEGRLEMLFLRPDTRGRGLGRQLLEYGIRNYAIDELTVNEQNPQAVGFYEHIGFTVYKRTPRDEQGGPYPLLYLRLN